MNTELEAREMWTIPTVTIEEPSHPLCNLIDGDILKRAHERPLYEGYLRWQTVGMGAAKPWIPERDPSPWHGYVIGLPSEIQEHTLHMLGVTILDGLQQSAKKYRCSSDRLLSVIQQDTPPTVKDVLALAPVFEKALVTMRTVGEEGITPFDAQFDIQEYSTWRTRYEQDLARIEKEWADADSAQRIELFTKEQKLKEQLRERLNLFTSISRPRSSMYRRFRQETAKRVGEVVSAEYAAERSPFVIDPSTGLVRYTLPKIVTVGSPSPYPDGGWVGAVALKIGDIAGHPIARAVVQEERKHRFSQRYW